MTDLKMAGAQKHEKDLAEQLGGRKTRGSGSQWHEKGDGRNDHFGAFAFAWDCKSTQRQSISVTLAMLEKIIEEAHGDRPALPLRFYSNARLDVAQDWIVVKLDDFTEILEAARRADGAVHVKLPEHLTDDQVEEFAQQLEERLKSGDWQARPASDSEIVMALHRSQESGARTQGELDLARENVTSLQRQLDEVRAELAARPAAPYEAQLIPATFTDEDKDRLRAEFMAELAREELKPVPAEPPLDIPHLPWTIITKLGSNHFGFLYDEQGHQHPFPVSEVRTEPISATAERLMVDNRQIRAGDLYIHGKLRLRVGA